MSFNWKAIQSYEDSEVALYRLLGEMLRRKANLSDLEQTRAFLLRANLNSDGWLSLGEALHRTTSGSPVGYDIWLAWLHTFDDVDVDVERLGGVWTEFGEDLSEVSEGTDFDPNLDVLPMAEPAQPQASGLPSIRRPIAPADLATIDDDDTDSTSITASQAVLRTSTTPNTGVLGESPTALMRLLPEGPFHLRIFGVEHPDVDEYTVLTLIKRGLFLAADVRAGDRWVSAADHPAFEHISKRLRAEASRILNRESRDQDEPTDPLGP